LRIVCSDALGPPFQKLSGAVLGRGMSNWYLVCERKEDCLPVLVVHLVRVLFPFGRICATLSAATRRNQTGLCATQQDEPWGPFASDVGGNSCGEFGGFAPTSVAKGS
jgi:hypothetical protein